MGTTIFYFTGTGNSLMVSRDLAKELGDARVVSIARAIREKEIDLSDECIGFVFPVYFGGIPAIVQDFVKKLPIDDTKYIFGIVTKGSPRGDALNHLSKLLSNKGLRLAAGFQVSMPHNHIILNDMIDEIRRVERFKLEKVRVKEFAGIIRIRKYIGLEKKTPLTLRLLASLPIFSYLRSASYLGRSANNFYADDHCMGCGHCEKICPVNNIEIINDKPVWHDRCQQCLACIHWCPKKAIQFGKSTQGRTRYTNPTITIKHDRLGRYKT